MYKKASIFLVFITLSAFVAPVAFSADEYIYSSISYKVYADGVTQVDSQIDVDPTIPRVNFTAQGIIISNLEVTDQDNTLLESRVVNGLIVVDVLGSTTINVAYMTSDLTSKTGSTWQFEATLPIDGNVLTPVGATIINMDPVPLSISVLGGRTTLTMPSGQVAISYIIGVVGTKEHALALLREAESTVETVLESGIIIIEAESLIAQAEEAYSMGSYAQTELLATQAKEKALEIQGLADEANSKISQAQNDIDATRSAGKITMIDAAEERLSSANLAYEQGDYITATTYAIEASRLAHESSSPGTQRDYTLLIFAFIVIAAVGIYLYMRRRGEEPQTVTIEAAPSHTDVQRVFDKNPTLRLDEKEVIRYINDSNEGVFITEIRDRFDIPKSSAWRMMRRLEEMKIVETEEVGRETFIRIHRRFRDTKADE